MGKNPYKPIIAKIKKIINETPTIKTFVFDLKEPIKFKAGQFMQLTVPGLGEAPFTPSSSPFISNEMEITILKTGIVTEALHNLKEGDEVGLRGPFGKGYPVEKFENKIIYIIGGGVGLAPLRSLIFTLIHNYNNYKKIFIKYGARSPEELCFKRYYDEWSKIPNIELEITIDKPYPDWTGKVGLVTTLLENLKIDKDETYAVSCGPEIMLKFVTVKLLEQQFDPYKIYLSMNRKM
ncbi:MAG TPA: FAD/NAD(P)-binding protein, partial [bacterium]|nr:FAD/NAD(P)-binding protein [bacterium]